MFYFGTGISLSVYASTGISFSKWRLIFKLSPSIAREIQLTDKNGDFLVLHLSELVRVAFMAATSDSDPLRLEGLKTLEVIIERFGETPEPEFPGMYKKELTNVFTIVTCEI